MDATVLFPSEFPLQYLPELTEEVFFTFQPDTNKILYLNAAFERIWNISRNDVDADMSLLYQQVHPDDRILVAASFGALKKDGKGDLDFRIQLPDATVKWIRICAYVCGNEGNKMIVGTATDISSFKSYNDTLHKYNDKKNSILQILSHDLLAPLTNIKLSIGLLNVYNGISDNNEIMNLVSIVNKNCQRGVALIQDLINNKFLQSSEAAIMKTRVDMVDKISQVINQFKQSPSNDTPQRFSFQHTVKTLFISVDESKFMQVLTNLLSNALKFTPDDGTITISLADQDNNILITVEDTGIGIPADLQPYLFDKFTRARRTGIKGEQSTGLGMSIIKTIIEWHHGKIWFESIENKGTTFYINIPKNN